MPDKTFDILIEIKSRLQSLQQAQGEMQSLTGEARNFNRTLADSDRTAAGLGAGIGNAVSVGVTAGFALYNILSSVGEEIRQMAADQAKHSLELNKQVRSWITLAEFAGKSGDVVKLGENMVGGLQAASARFDEFRNRELTLWQTFKNGLTAIPFVSPEGLLKEALDRDKATADRDFRAILNDFNALIARGTEAAETMRSIKTEPFREGIAEINGEIEKLKPQLAELDKARVPAANATTDELKRAAVAAEEFVQKSAKINLWQERLREAQKALQQFNAETEAVSTQLQRLDFEQLDPAQRIPALSQQLSDIRQKLIEVGVTAATPEEALKQMANVTRENAAEALKLLQTWLQVRSAIADANAEAAANAISSFNAVRQIEEQTAILRAKNSGDQPTADRLQVEQQIGTLYSDLVTKQHVSAEEAWDMTQALQEQLIREKEISREKGASAAVSRAMTDAKREERDLAREQAEIMARITAQQGAVSANPFLLLPEKNEQMIASLLKLAAAHREAGDETAAHRAELEALALTPMGEFQASMIDWANSFGTAASQSASLIQGTLNTAISQTSKLLTDAIFRTGDWEKAILSVGETGVQMLIEMGLQMIIQNTLGRLLKQQTTQESVSQNATVLASAAPAAVAEGASSWGSNWIIAAIAAAAAIGLIAAALSGAFHTGGVAGRERGGRRGRSGALQDDEMLSILLRDEVVLTPEQAAQTAIVGDPAVFTPEQLAAMSVSPDEALLSVTRKFHDGGVVDPYANFTMPVARSRMHEGAPIGVGASGGSSSSGGNLLSPKIEIYHFTDMDAMTQQMMNSDANKKFVVSTMKNTIHEVGINAV